MFATSACRTIEEDRTQVSTKRSFTQFQVALKSGLTPHEHEQYLALTKLWSHRRINIDMYATGVLGLLQSHPELMSGFAAFFPPARDVLVSSTSSRATHDPLSQPPTAVPHDTKKVVEEFLEAVRERFADRPMVYDTFLRVLQKYRCASLCFCYCRSFQLLFFAHLLPCIRQQRQARSDEHHHNTAGRRS
ncbi:hypothetical protein K523DRAFT_25375 [Schizophyllum commune Tattone D]|nr:hypothetical protein K523DRAFT_25375 [Schizophyllum commune Tattone D]